MAKLMFRTVAHYYGEWLFVKGSMIKAHQ